MLLLRFLCYRLQVRIKMIQYIFSGQLNTKSTYFLCRNWQKTSCELCYYADENFDMLSVTMPGYN